VNRPEHQVEIKLTEALHEAVKLGNEVNSLRGRLAAINTLACYASEEDTDLRAEVLLQIGRIARYEVNLRAVVELKKP